MAEQVPPEQVIENELICEKLLGWRVIRPDDDAPLWCVPPTRGFTRPTPSFATWADAGLIAEAFARHGIDYDLETTLTEDGTWSTVRVWPDYRPIEPRMFEVRAADAGPLAFRAAAIEYIRRQS